MVIVAVTIGLKQLIRHNALLDAHGFQLVEDELQNNRPWPNESIINDVNRNRKVKE